MKISKLFLSVILCVVTCNCLAEKNHLQQSCLKGKVKSLKSVPYNALENSEKPTKGDINIYASNSMFFFNGNPSCYFLCNYNEKGNISDVFNYDSVS